MSFRESKGNMFGFVTHTANFVSGKCPHDCLFCYLKRFPQKEIHLDKKMFNTDLGKGNYIFIGSGNDMFANEVPNSWITDILDYCNNFDNKYLFLTKNPKRYNSCIKRFPKNTILGISLESDVNYPITNAPAPRERWKQFKNLNFPHKMVCIEPILDFHIKYLLNYIDGIENLDFVVIGADSKGHHLREPTSRKISCFLEELKQISLTTVLTQKGIEDKERFKIIIKPNLARLL